MSKKEVILKEGRFRTTFNLGGVNSLLGDPDTEYKKEPKPKPKKVGRPKTSTKVITQGNTPEDGTKEGERRATYIVKKEAIEKIEAIAYWESYNQTIKNKQPTTVMIKDVVGEALQEYILKWEKKNGPVQSKPKKQ